MRGIVTYAAASVLLATGTSCAAPSREASPLLTPAATVRVGQQPNDVLLQDVNGDGYLDIVAADMGSRGVSVVLGDGSGRFAPASGSPVRVGIAPHLLATGDFDGDGRIDLAITGHDWNEMTVLRGDGRGGFEPMRGSPVAFLKGAKAHNHGLVVGDIDRDGDLDVATSNHDANSVSILHGDGRGGFRAAPGSPVAVGRGPYPLAMGDLDGDETLDIVTPDVGGNTVTVLLGDGRGGFAGAGGSPHRVDSHPYHATLARVNGDLALDLVVSHDNSGQLTLLLGDGRGGFGRGRRVDVGGRPWKVRAADMNRDGSNDLVMGTRAGVVVLLGDGEGNFARAPGFPVSAGRGAWSVAVGDVDRDGDLDVVTANFESNDVSVLFGR